MSESKQRLQRENDELRRQLNSIGVFIEDVKEAAIMIVAQDHQRGVRALRAAIDSLPKPSEEKPVETRRMSPNAEMLLAMIGGITAGVGALPDIRRRLR